MRALMVNSTGGKVVDEKMRDQVYMRHLRQVEMINNREAEQVSRDLQNYRSINDLHHKHKSYAFDWHHKEEHLLIEERNQKMKKKMNEMRSFFQFKRTQPHPNSTNPTDDNYSPSQLPPQPEKSTQPYEQVSPERNSADKSPRKEKAQLSLHYRYRKRRQEQIDHQNFKLQQGILSQRSSYLPRIAKTRMSSSVNKVREQKSPPASNAPVEG